MGGLGQGGRYWSNDFLGGVLLIAIAAFVAISTLNLEIEGDQGIGPGYFPVVGAIVLFALGAILCCRALLRPGAVVDFRHGILPAAFITASVLLFAALLYSAGLAISVLVTAVIASSASREMRLSAKIYLAIFLMCLTLLIFGLLLSLPMPFWPAWMSG
jgi:hypothetical protein